jgi:hypothetical protein
MRLWVKWVISLLFLCLTIGATNATAHHKHWSHHFRHVSAHHVHHPAVADSRHAKSVKLSSNIVGTRPSDCFGIPWCGCWLRTQVSHDPGPAFNLAANWAHCGHVSVLDVGAIVVHPHHVDIVEKLLGDGHYLARGGNVRHDNYAHVYNASVKGAIAIRRE